MSESYPRRNQASGIWKINDITKNIKEDGTYPQLNLGDRMLVSGGSNPSITNTIESIEISTAGNAANFGDLVTAGSHMIHCSDAHGGLIQ